MHEPIILNMVCGDNRQLGIALPVTGHDGVKCGSLTRWFIWNGEGLLDKWTLFSDYHRNITYKLESEEGAKL